MNSLSNMFDKPTVGEKRRTGHLPHPWFASAARSSTQRGSIWAGYASPSAVKTLAAARIHFPRAFKYRRVRQAFGLRNPKRKTRLTSCLFLKCQINLDIYSPKDPDFCPAALLRRTSVFAAGENLGAGRIHCTAVGGFAALRMWCAPCGCFRPSM